MKIAKLVYFYTLCQLHVLYNVECCNIYIYIYIYKSEGIQKWWYKWYVALRKRCARIYLQGFRKTSTYLHVDSSGITIQLFLGRRVKHSGKAEKLWLVVKLVKYLIKISFVLSNIYIYIWRESPPWASASSFTRFLGHTQRRTTVGRTPLDEWSASRTDLHLTTHNTHNRQTSMPPGGIRTHSLSRRAATDLRLRTRGHWDLLWTIQFIGN